MNRAKDSQNSFYASIIRCFKTKDFYSLNYLDNLFTYTNVFIKRAQSHKLPFQPEQEIKIKLIYEIKALYFAELFTFLLA